MPFGTATEKWDNVAYSVRQISKGRERFYRSSDEDLRRAALRDTGLRGLLAGK